MNLFEINRILQLLQSNFYLDFKISFIILCVIIIFYFIARRKILPKENNNSNNSNNLNIINFRWISGFLFLKLSDWQIFEIDRFFHFSIYHVKILLILQTLIFSNNRNIKCTCISILKYIILNFVTLALILNGFINYNYNHEEEKEEKRMSQIRNRNFFFIVPTEVSSVS